MLTPERLASCRKDYDAILADGEAANPRAPPSGKRGLAAGVIEAVRRFRLDGHAADGIDNVARHGFQNRRRMAVMMSMVVMLP